MASLIEQEIRERLVKYLGEETSLNDLRLWLMPQLWTIDRESDCATFQIASKIALYIAEYGAGHRTPSELRELLKPFTFDGRAVPARDHRPVKDRLGSP
jgi:hypothetical protein